MGGEPRIKHVCQVIELPGRFLSEFIKPFRQLIELPGRFFQIQNPNIMTLDLTTVRLCYPLQIQYLTTLRLCGLFQIQDLVVYSIRHHREWLL